MLNIVFEIRRPSCSAEWNRLGNFGIMKNISVIVFGFGPVVQGTDVVLIYFLSRAMAVILFTLAEPFKQLYQKALYETFL